MLVCSVDVAQSESAGAIARTLRGTGMRVVLDVSDRRLDRKLRAADRLGTRAAVIVGEQEVADASAQLRDLSARSQQTVPLGELVEAASRILR